MLSIAHVTEVIRLKPIPDFIRPQLNILFVGFNPSCRSGETGFHYANPHNRFWKILHLSGLTPRKYAPEEHVDFLTLGYGLTNIVERPTRTAEEITQAEYDEGRNLLKKKIITNRPSNVCYVGKGVYQQFSGRKDIPWGFQTIPVVDGVRDFVAPSSSGLVRMKLDEVLSIYRDLAQSAVKPSRD
jgi:TDG/mug DNA glycosylase family protein